MFVFIHLFCSFVCMAYLLTLIECLPNAFTLVLKKRSYKLDYLERCGVVIFIVFGFIIIFEVVFQLKKLGRLPFKWTSTWSFNVFCVFMFRSKNDAIVSKTFKFEKTLGFLQFENNWGRVSFFKNWGPLPFSKKWSPLPFFF